tara:strand:+ start:2129 stop:2299 length:171 start_codon:yes stop_codon:yes gene_type:complete
MVALYLYIVRYGLVIPYIHNEQNDQILKQDMTWKRHRKARQRRRNPVHRGMDRHTR